MPGKRRGPKRRTANDMLKQLTIDLADFEARQAFGLEVPEIDRDVHRMTLETSSGVYAAASEPLVKRLPCYPGIGPRVYVHYSPDAPHVPVHAHVPGRGYRVMLDDDAVIVMQTGPHTTMPAMHMTKSRSLP